jgi:pimeloyl-ACP methyl ester carboxylesterase
MPLTLIWGAQDSCLGIRLVERSKRLADDLHVHVLRDAGHFVHQEAAEQVIALLLEALTADQAQ